MARTGTATGDFPQFCDEIEFASETEWLDADQDYYGQPEEIMEVSDVCDVDDVDVYTAGSTPWWR